MKLQPLCVTIGMLISLATSSARADYLIYRIPTDGANRMSSGPGGGPGYGPGAGAGPRPGMIPGGAGMPPGGPGMMPGMGGDPARANELRMVLNGRSQTQGKLISFNHQSVRDPLFFDPKDVEVIKAPTTQQEYNRQMGAAGKDADAVMKASLWGLKRGLLREFHAGVEKALSLNPQHEIALKVSALKKKLDEPLSDNPGLEQQLRNDVQLSGLQVATSKHFLMLHDLPQKPAQGKRKGRAQERLDMLEEVYESFLLLFQSQDVDLEVPQERLKVVLLKDRKDFQDLVTSFNPALVGESGFWDPARNVTVFCDQGTSKTQVALQKLQGDMKKSAEDAKKNRTNQDVIRQAKTIDLLIDIDAENSDTSSVTHEATHQMAGNTGLLPRHVDVPAWMHEGLATYFEAPQEAAWAGIGAVSQDRMDAYRVLEPDRAHSNIDFIVGDQIIGFAKVRGALPLGSAQTWGLTHFLLENHTRELVSYYRMVGEMPPDLALNPRLLTELFSRVFGSDRTALDREWRQYMRALKTDVERFDDGSNTKART